MIKSINNYLSIVLLLLLAFSTLAFSGNNFIFASPASNIKILLNGLPVYEQANENSLIITSVDMNQIYEVICEENNFYCIKLNEPFNQGYVLKAYTQDASINSPIIKMDTNATLTKNTFAYKLENTQYVKLENVKILADTRIKLIEGYNSKNEYQKATIQVGDSLETYYFLTSDIDPDGINSRILIAILLIVVCVSIFLILYSFMRGKKK